MLNFIKKVVNNPGNFTEDEKYKMLWEAMDKEIEAEELAKIITFIKSKQAIKINLCNAIDIAGTGGSGLPRINTSTLTCLLLAKQGIVVAKHWNNASSGRFWSFDLIEELWYKIPKNKNEITKEIEENNCAFLYAKNFYPFFKEFGEVRKKYGKPTVFNLIGPLLNPANTDIQIIGCSREDKMELLIETCKILGRKKVLVVRWEDGLDEVTLSTRTKVYELNGWVIKQYYIEPEDFGLKTCKSEEIYADKISEKIRIAKKIIAWEKIGKYSDLVELNRKVALDLIKK